MMQQLVAVAERRSARVTAIGIVGFAAALALASQVAIPVPGSPVPATLQPLVVALAGLWLGPWAGAASMLLYLAVGATGAPVFAPFGAPGIARFFGPTGGYLMAYPAAAFVAGWLGRRNGSFIGRAIAAMASTVVLFIGGLAHLAVLNGSFARALDLGMHPFVPLDAAKAILAALLAPRRGAVGGGRTTT
jgi:biotin transport system substrate-specific component